MLEFRHDGAVINPEDCLSTAGLMNRQRMRSVGATLWSRLTPVLISTAFDQVVGRERVDLDLRFDALKRYPWELLRDHQDVLTNVNTPWCLGHPEPTTHYAAVDPPPSGHPPRVLVELGDCPNDTNSKARQELMLIEPEAHRRNTDVLLRTLLHPAAADIETALEVLRPDVFHVHTRAAEQASDRLRLRWLSPSAAIADTPDAGPLPEETRSMPNANEPRPRSLRIGTELPGGDILIQPFDPEPDGSEPNPSTVVPADVVARGPYSLAHTPERFFQELRQTLGVEALDRALSPTGSRPLHLYLATEDAARWPWEAAMIDDSGIAQAQRPLPGVQLMLRRRFPLPSGEETPVASTAVLVTMLNERRDRGHVLRLLDSFYDGRAELIVQRSFGKTGGEPAARILHVITDLVQRNRIPALRVSSGNHLTSESLAMTIGAGPRLLILDLVLAGSDSDATEQLMIANAFCWQLVRIAPELDVLCGVFGGANDRVGSLRQLVEHLAAGDSLGATVADLQRNRALLPGGRHPVRDVVSLSTDHPDRRFLLGGQP